MKKVLCVCSMGINRSPTLARVLCMKSYNYDTRSCGTDAGSLIPLTRMLLRWADVVVCAEKYHWNKVKKLLNKIHIEIPIYTLHIPDRYEYNSLELIRLIELKLIENSFND